MIYFNIKILVIFLLGIASGIPLSLSASTLVIMLAENGVDLAQVSLFALAGLPYVFKFVWAPLLDSLEVPWLSRVLGRRRSWLLLVQVLLALSIVALGSSSMGSLFLIGISAISLSFFSATQDVIIDAYRIEILSQDEQSAGAGAAIFGYRVGMLLSGGGSLYAATYLSSWQATYTLLSLFLLPGGLAALFYGEPKRTPDLSRSFASRLNGSYIKALREFVTREGWLWIVLLVIFYKASDAYVGRMTNIFLLDLGFSKIEIANIIKVYGFAAATFGALLGGYLIAKCNNIARMLLLGLVLQQLSNLGFILQFHYGYNQSLLIATISIENICSSISNVALTTYISQLVWKEYTATQYALLSALAAFSRTLLSATAGAVVVKVGWVNFFLISAIMSLPSLPCLYYIFYRKR